MTFEKEIIKQLSQELELPFTGQEQDWDIEMANPNRIDDFIKFYNHQLLSSDKKIAIMSLIIASYEDFLNMYNLEVDEQWNEIELILKTESNTFSELINYWSLDDENDGNDIFRITPLMRKIK